MNPQAPPTPGTSSNGTVTDTSIIAATLMGSRGVSPLGDISDKVYDQQVKETPTDEPAQPKQDPEKPAETPAPATDTVTTDDEPEGYFADEGLDDDEPPTPPSPTPAPAANPLPASFNAEEQYIAANIGQPLTVRIKVGDQIQNVQAYSPDNLPENFEYATERDRTQALLGFDSLSRKAEKLQADYQAQEQQKSAQKFSSDEDRDIQRDIAYLQRRKQAGHDGLDLFKYPASDERFGDDPAVKEMQEVLNYYNEENQNRWTQSQRTGRQFRPLTYQDAFKIYRIDNPKVGAKQKEEDAQRKEITKPLAKAGKSSGDETPKQQRPRLPRSASIDQIINAYKL